MSDLLAHPAAGHGRGEGGFGIRATLRAARSELERAASLLESFGAAQAPRAGEPFRLGSKRLCVAAYTEALGLVRQRFWATSVLSSGFWSERDPRILGANLGMMERLNGNGTAARRLFLLHNPPEAEVRSWQDERLLLAKQEDAEGLAHFDRRFANLRRNLENLRAQGCEARVVHDDTGLERGLPPELHFDPEDSELALYDDWRFDLFQGGRSGSIDGVECYTPVMEGFAAHLRAVSGYFAALWERATPVTGLLERIERALEDCASRIDYQPTWLACYDYGLPEEDESLKAAELDAVAAELRRLGRWGTIRRFLDVGTCTGRYPISLREAVLPEGEIVGIDNDMDCVRFARWKLRQECGDDARLRIERHDFSAERWPIAGTFDLITCMLGTLSHFGRGRMEGPPFHDPFQRALEKFSLLLAESGLLFFTVWGEPACHELRMLSIYSAEDMRRLAQWAPARRELESRLHGAGLDFAPPLQLLGRLELYRCSRAARRG
ncbi:MAG TPA: class I SAM-dependent methyltransferase [Thermoanaerobaculia bacterium]|nr:class I SAM-dependent methyltransferase [Thermoanaerobaculia bacterium]